VQVFQMLTQFGQPPSAAMKAGLPVCIVVLLAEVHTLKGDNGVRKRKEMPGIRIPYLICVHCVESCCVAGSLGLPRRWNRGHTFFSE
jgi:hypothetical protein